MGVKLEPDEGGSAYCFVCVVVWRFALLVVVVVVVVVLFNTLFFLWLRGLWRLLLMPPWVFLAWCELYITQMNCESNQLLNSQLNEIKTARKESKLLLYPALGVAFADTIVVIVMAVCLFGYAK